MKNSKLMLCMSLLSSATLFAVDSPYKGLEIGREQLDDVYLYQVETGQWIQNNYLRGHWTTRAELGKEGMDLKLIPVEGGWQIDPKHYNNHSINGDRYDGDANLHMDTNDAVTIWDFEPVEGAANVYRLKAVAGSNLPGTLPLYYGANEEGRLDDGYEGTWQIVGRSERIEHMKAEAAAGRETQASWLIPGFDMQRFDERYDNTWATTFISHDSGNGWRDAFWNVGTGAMTREGWNNVEGFITYATATGLPNGHYKFRAQAYYRDAAWDDGSYGQRILDNATIDRAYYFANTGKAPVMPIHKELYAEWESANGQFVQPHGTDIHIPNDLDTGSFLLGKGMYWNEWVDAYVTDGKITVGIEKREYAPGEWIVWNQVELKYVGQDTEAEDLNAAKESLMKAIDRFEGLTLPDGISSTVAEAKAAYEGTSSSDIVLSTIKLNNILLTMSSSLDHIKHYTATKNLIPAGTDIAKAEQMFNTAANESEFAAALKELRFNRRRAVAERHDPTFVFEGNAPADGLKCYLYNVGQRQFFSGGSDWGAHAALSPVGIEVTLIAGQSDGLFGIETGLYNGETLHFLNFRGYCDSFMDLFKFIPVEGKQGVYNIVQNNNNNRCMAWDTAASTDGNNGDETNVGTECEGRDLANDADAQWIIVTKADRLALMGSASADHPADLSFLIKSPGFNQREEADDSSVWEREDMTVAGYGQNRHDFVCESYNKPSFLILQEVYFSQSVAAGLSTEEENTLPANVFPAGDYILSAQGYHRDGAYDTQIEAEKCQKSHLFVNYGEDDITADFPNIISESGNAPGEGRIIGQYEIPDNCERDAIAYFKAGLYRTDLKFRLTEPTESLQIGAERTEAAPDFSWNVVDNFRLKYLGDTLDAIENVVIPESTSDNRIFNLQGIQVKEMTSPGIYIQNGKKIIVR